MGNERRFRTSLLAIVCSALFILTMLGVLVANRGVAHASDSQLAANDLVDASPLATNDSTLANCRYGITTAEGTSHIVPRTGAGVFYKFNQPNWYGPLPGNDAELLHMIKTRQRKTSTGDYLPAWYIQNYDMDEELAGYIRDDPGAVWIVGNEVERGPNSGEVWSARTGDMYADMYAEAYHDLYHFIKGIDPTARVANAGLIQITPMRLQYLDQMWEAYQRKYGEDMPVDVWTIHTYVLPELTADGQPNNIANAALGTDIALGKRNAGGDTTKCSDDMVYCYAEHDDMSILQDQVVAMRLWMKDHGQREKPLIITEYGTIYHYIVKENGSCGGLRDEYGQCFTPERVTKFLLNSFDYFNYAARDDSIGLPSDNNRLVQQWIWYGAWEWDIGSSNLLKSWNDTEFTLMGEAFQDYVQAEQTYVNLLVDEVYSTVVAYNDDDTATAKLSVNFRNNGNVPVEDSFKVTFYSDENLTQEIGSAVISTNIRGCASRAYNAEVDWSDLPKGTHPFWVKLDSNNQIVEKPADKIDNIGSGQVEATGPVYTLDIEIVNDGDGQGGVVTIDPTDVAYAEGTVIKLTAVPYSGWTFEKWSGAIAGNNSIAHLTILDDVVVTAHFKQEQYELEIKTVGEGQVIVTPEPTKDYYLYGEQVELLAIPEEEWRFIEYSGDIENDAPSVIITFESDVATTATFEKLLANVEGTIFMPMTARK